jgi:chaperonin GroES
LQKNIRIVLKEEFMAIKMQPMADLVLVKPNKSEQVSRGGIVLPDTAKEKPQEGTVIAVGTGRVSEAGKKVPMEIAVGDVVLFSKYGGTEITVEGDELVMLHEADILAKKIA